MHRPHLHRGLRSASNGWLRARVRARPFTYRAELVQRSDEVIVDDDGNGEENVEASEEMEDNRSLDASTETRLLRVLLGERGISSDDLHDVAAAG